MRSLIHFITRKSRGGIAIREKTVESETLVGGRGNDCDLHLPDPRVLYHHVEFALRSGKLYASAIAGGDLRVNGNLTESGKLAIGHEVRVGPYEITVEPPPEGIDIALSVEMVQPLGDDLEKLVARSQIHITRIGFSLRTWSWIFACLVIAVTLAAPWTLNRLMPPPAGARALNPFFARPSSAPTKVWTSGPVSAAHKFFGDNCETCHEKAFVPVQDSACLACHTGIQNHADPKHFAFARFTDTKCEDCHKEHRGNVTIALDDQKFCASCHGDLVRQAHGTTLRNVTDFTVDHPQFRPTVIVDTVSRATDRSRAVGDTQPPRQNMGLKFPHDKHLMTTGVRNGAGALVKLDCADCHLPDSGGVSMRSITFERNCHSCHQLTFDANVPSRELVHARPEQMFAQVHDVYEAIALQGGYAEPEAPEIVRRRPGTPLTEAEKKEVGDWAAVKADEIINGRFGKGLCEECHTTISAVAPAGAGSPTSDAHWTVAPVMLDEQFFPRAKFNHAQHGSTECRYCHAAAQSMSSSEVLMPGIAVCKSCHGSPKAEDRVPSSCIECHAFHRKDLGPMHDEDPHESKAAAVVP